MSAYHAIAILWIGRALQIVAGFLTIRLATTLLSPDQFGIVNQMTSLSMLGTAAVLLPMSAYITRTLMERHARGVLRQKLIRYLVQVVSAGLLFGVLASLVQHEVNLVSGLSAGWVGGLVTLHAIGYSTHITGISGLNLLGHRTLYVLFGTIAVWSGLCFALILTHASHTPELWVLGMFVGFLVSSVSFWLLIQRCESCEVANRDAGVPAFRDDSWIMFSYVWPQTIVFVLWWIQSQSYRFILSQVADIAQVGLFATAYMICSVPMQMFESLFNELYSPRFFRDLKGQGVEGMASAWNSYAAAYIPAAILFGAFLIGGSAFLVQLFLGPQFHAVTPMLFLPAITETLRGISSSLHQLGIAKVDMSVNLLPVGVGAALAPTLVYMFGAYSPLWGTALALLVAGMASFVLIFPASSRALPVTWPVRKIGLALLCGLPIVGVGKGYYLISPNPTMQESVTALLLLGIATLLAQYVFAQKWIHTVSLPVEAVR